MSYPLAFLAIFTLSANDDKAAWAQQDPQYYGTCWFKFLVKYDVPLMFPQFHSFGKSSSEVYV